MQTLARMDQMVLAKFRIPFWNTSDALQRHVTTAGLYTRGEYRQRDTRRKLVLTNPEGHFHCGSCGPVKVIYNVERVEDIQRSGLHSIGMASKYFCGARIDDAGLHTTPRHP